MRTRPVIQVPRRLRRVALAAMIVGAVGAAGPSSAVAVTGQGGVTGPWSCGPDQTVSLTMRVTGTGNASVDLVVKYVTGGGIEGFYEPTLYPGYTTVRPPDVGRTIFWFVYQTYGNANLRSWVKNCT
jgi:hypothetical protein